MKFFYTLFRRREDGRCEPRADIAQLEREINENLAKRKAARLIANPHERGWETRKINAGVR